MATARAVMPKLTVFAAPDVDVPVEDGELPVAVVIDSWEGVSFTTTYISPVASELMKSRP